jgi:hypothetical protein
MKISNINLGGGCQYRKRLERLFVGLETPYRPNLFGGIMSHTSATQTIETMDKEAQS